jgi:hypothetical protein
VNRSVPLHPKAPPRSLADAERTALVCVADALIPARADDTAPSATPDYARHLDRALAARDDAFDAVVEAATRLAALDDAARGAKLRSLHAAGDATFQALSAVVCGAYLTVPEVRARIGYPGQERSPAPFDLAAEEIMDGILDPVLEQGEHRGRAS